MSLKVIGFRREFVLWSKVKVRKHHKCCNCGIALNVGDEAYRPTGNRMYRYARMCLTCAEAWDDLAA